MDISCTSTVPLFLTLSDVNFFDGLIRLNESKLPLECGDIGKRY